MKLCLKCNSEILNRRSDAKYCSSKCCNNHKQKQFRDRQPEEVKAQWRKYFYTERGTITALLNNAFDRSKKQKIPFNLDREWLEEKLKPMICELSGLPLEKKPRDKFRINPFAPSLDKIIPSLGYVKSNVRVVAFVVNLSRSEYGDEILLTMAHALVNKYKELIS